MLRVLIILSSLVADRVDRARDESGATAVEYGLMLALIAAVIVVAVTALGSNVNAKFVGVCADVKGSPC